MGSMRGKLLGGFKGGFGAVAVEWGVGAGSVRCREQDPRGLEALPYPLGLLGTGASLPGRAAGQHRAAPSAFCSAPVWPIYRVRGEGPAGAACRGWLRRLLTGRRPRAPAALPREPLPMQALGWWRGVSLAGFSLLSEASREKRPGFQLQALRWRGGPGDLEWGGCGVSHRWNLLPWVVGRTGSPFEPAGRERPLPGAGSSRHVALAR